MKKLQYKGYQAAVVFEDGSLFVRVLHLDDLLIGYCDKASEVESVFEGLIEDYLQDCAELGREPTKPFKGSFNIRVTPEIHRLAAMASADEEVSLNNWVLQAIEEKLECSRMSTRMDNMFSSRQEDIQALKVQESFMRNVKYLEFSSEKRAKLQGELHYAELFSEAEETVTRRFLDA